MKLQTGQKAPDLSLPDQNGQKVKLSNFLGQWVLVYFYPKDDTPGCTKEACSLRDNLPDFSGLKVKILGVSTDSVASHKKFEQKYNLNFTILADTEKTVVNDYGVWQPKKFLGREFLGTVRTSFLVNPEGVLAKIYPNVKPEIHAAQVLSDLKTLVAAK